MTSPQRPGADDWRRPPGPSAFATWVADHRLLTRIILIGLDTALVVLIVTGLFSGGDHWTAYLQLPVYAWLTWSIGWTTPKSVDDWKTARRLRPPTSREQAPEHDLNS
jgi:hypothetical protein